MIEQIQAVLAKMDTSKLTLAQTRKKINNVLWRLTANRYFDAIPHADINTILAVFGLAMQDGIYCGNDGRAHEEVGKGLYILLTWYRMGSGRYEIVCYVS